MRTLDRYTIVFIMLSLLFASTPGEAGRKKNKREGKADPYAEYVWPPPPDEPRIKLEQIITGRIDVEARSRFRRKLMGTSPQGRYDRLSKPHAVDFDGQGRIVVTDVALGALIRFDPEGRRMDVFGTKGRMRLRSPLGLDVAPNGVIYVADVGMKKVLAFDAEGEFLAAYGHEGDLVNPTDAALSPEGSRLFVADSKAHTIVVFDADTGELVSSFGGRGTEEGEFNYPTSLTFGPEGNLFVVDQMNCRVQVFEADGEYVDQFGGRGIGAAGFVRPKDVAVDGRGLVYVTDNAFNNVQLFDDDFTLLTFVGDGGLDPGQFHGASGLAVQGDRFAVVDQLGKRVQVFRFVGPDFAPN